MTAEHLPPGVASATLYWETRMDPEQPIAWKVVLSKPQTWSSPQKIEPYEVNFAGKDQAVEYKRLMQADGWVANAVPVFVTPELRDKARKKSQGRTAPPGFNKDWRLRG
jgi:hypothetical protein